VSGDRLDDAIDGAVREIMGTEPPAGLRQRVIRRLSEPDRRAWFAVPRLAVVAAVVLCVAVGAFVVLMVNRGRTPSIEVASAPRSTRPTEPRATAPAVTRGAPPAIATRTTREPGTIVGARSVRRQDERMVTAASLAEAETVVISPLDPLRNIDPAPMRSEVVQMDAIAIAPLQQMEPVTIEPLSSTPR
jgi:hypothetical protein